MNTTMKHCDQKNAYQFFLNGDVKDNEVFSFPSDFEWDMIYKIAGLHGYGIIEITDTIDTIDDIGCNKIAKVVTYSWDHARSCINRHFYAPLENTKDKVIKQVNKFYLHDESDAIVIQFNDNTYTTIAMEMVLQENGRYEKKLQQINNPKLPMDAYLKMNIISPEFVIVMNNIIQQTKTLKIKNHLLYQIKKAIKDFPVEANQLLIDLYCNTGRDQCTGCAHVEQKLPVICMNCSIGRL